MPLARDEQSGPRAEDSDELITSDLAVASFPHTPIATPFHSQLNQSGHIFTQDAFPSYGSVSQGQSESVGYNHGGAAPYQDRPWMMHQPASTWQQSPSIVPNNIHATTIYSPSVLYPELASQVGTNQWIGIQPVSYGQPFTRNYASSIPASQINSTASYVAPVLQQNTCLISNGTLDLEHTGTHALYSGHKDTTDANIYGPLSTGALDNFNCSATQYDHFWPYDPNIGLSTMPPTMTPTQSFFDAQTQQLNLRNDEQSWAQPVHVLVSQGEIESNDSSDWLTVGQYNHEVRPRFTPSSSEDATADVNQLSEGRESSWEVLSRELSTRESSGDVVVVQGVGRDEDDMGPFPSPPRADDLGPSSNRHKKNTKDKSAILKPKRTDQRVRGKLTEQERRGRKEMRQTGSCLRCRVFNEKCNTGDPCDRCIKALSEPRSYHDPCYRDKLDKITTARHGNNNFGQREVEFLKYNWHPDADVKTIDIKWSLPGGRSVDLPGIRLDCRRFVPLNNDSHYITWQVNDEVVTIELPPYSGEDTAVITASVQQFLRGGNKAVLDYLIQDVEGKGDTFGAVSLREAMRYADKNPNSTVDLALRIRSAAYCSQGWGTVSGSETLGIGEFDFNEKGQCGYSAYDRGQERPLPLSIDHQIDVALLKTIRIMQDHLVKKLAKMIFQKSGRKPWYEIFLTMYVLLSNLEYVHFGSLSFLRAQMKTKSEQSCAFLTREMVAEYNYSAENLLHHFRAILRAQYGFKVARKNLAEFVKAESLDDESAQYIQRVLETLDARKLQPRVSPPPASDVLEEPPPDGRWLNKLFEIANTDK